MPTKDQSCATHASHVQAGEPDQEQAESARGATESKADRTSRSRQQAQDHEEGNHGLSSGAEHSSPDESNPRESNTSESDFVRSLVHDIMTKAAAEAKGASAETKEAEKLAADAAKSPKPKDEVALKKGTTGKAHLGSGVFALLWILPSQAIGCSDRVLPSPLEFSAH